MNTINKFLILLMLALPFVGFTGCKDKDKEEDKGDTKSIAGTYNGSLVNQTMGINIQNVDITVTYVSETKVTLSLDQTLSVTIPNVGEQTIPFAVSCECDVTYADGKYSLTGNTQTAEIPELGALKVVIKDSTIDGSGNANLKITPTVGIMPIEITFNGKKK
ncbi:MAG: calycin-like domain-containing protein [Bacteroidales bacterium]|nr:calycin-like domain-containing protein [Bacteroidales bacterium]